jgi:hypothetical protein
MRIMHYIYICVESNVDGLELALKSHCGVVVLDELVELVGVADVEFAEAENPLVDVD